MGGMLRSMLGHLHSKSIEIAVVSRNSRHVVSKVLRYADLHSFIPDELIFGFEDYADDVPKSRIVSCRILHVLGIPEVVTLFVDDDPSNIRDIQNRCPNISVLQSPRFGLGQLECTQIKRWADALRSPVTG